MPVNIGEYDITLPPHFRYEVRTGPEGGVLAYSHLSAAQRIVADDIIASLRLVPGE